jgi:hypothetical protein
MIIDRVVNCEFPVRKLACSSNLLIPFRDVYAFYEKPEAHC